MGSIVAIGGGDVSTLVTQPIDNDCAVAFTSDGYRVIAASPGAGAYSLYVRRGEVVERTLPVTSDYLPIESLYER